MVVVDDQYLARSFFEMHVRMSERYELAASLANAEQAVAYCAATTAEAKWIEKARRGGIDSFWFKEYSGVALTEVMDRTMAGESVYPDSPPKGDNSPNWKSTLNITGSMWGYQYRCKATSSVTGAVGYSSSAYASSIASTWLEISDPQTAGCRLTAVISGGIAPFTVKAYGYAEIPTTYDIEWGEKVNWHEGYTWEDTISPTSYYQNGDTSWTYIFDNAYRYRQHYGGGGENYFPFYCKLGDFGYAPMTWRVEVTDATGHTYYSNWVKVEE